MIKKVKKWDAEVLEREEREQNRRKGEKRLGRTG